MGYGIFQGSMYLGKKRRMDLTFTTTGNFTSDVGLNGGAGEGMAQGIERSRVNTLSGEENVVFNYHTGRHRLSAQVDAKVNRYYGSTLGFTNKHSVVTKSGVSAVLNLPKEWGISTDVNLYTRRGYSDSHLNTTDLVWNARITKSVMKGKLLFIADAYDILRQLSNITYTVNAQARVETVSNVIPAFVLFHVQYRFNRQPRGAK